MAAVDSAGDGDEEVQLPFKVLEDLNPDRVARHENGVLCGTGEDIGGRISFQVLAWGFTRQLILHALPCSSAAQEMRACRHHRNPQNIHTAAKHLHSGRVNTCNGQHISSHTIPHAPADRL